MEERKNYDASCHCGEVKYEVTMAAPSKAFACNCSICRRAGWLLAFVPQPDFRLLSGEGALADYQFGKKNTHHFFCKTCGVRSFSRGKGQDGKEWVAVNLRCVTAFDPTTLPVETFDGASI